MSNTFDEYSGGGETGRNVVQDEEYVSNRPTREGAVRTGGELRGGEGMGGFTYEDLPDER